MIDPSRFYPSFWKLVYSFKNCSLSHFIYKLPLKSFSYSGLSLDIFMCLAIVQVVFSSWDYQVAIVNLLLHFCSSQPWHELAQITQWALLFHKAPSVHPSWHPSIMTSWHPAWQSRFAAFHQLILSSLCHTLLLAVISRSGESLLHFKSQVSCENGRASCLYTYYAVGLAHPHLNQEIIFLAIQSWWYANLKLPSFILISSI